MSYSAERISELEQKQRKLAKEQNDLADEIKKLKEPKPWDEVPGSWVNMIWLGMDGDAVLISSDLSYEEEWLQGNLFETREEARKERDKRQALARIKRHAKHVNDGWEPDWGDAKQLKHYVYWRHGCEEFKISSLSFDYDLAMTVNYRSREAAEEAIQECGDDYKVLFGVV